MKVNRPAAINKRESGFTLVELMVVLAIIGVLAGILFSSYALYIEKARITAYFQNGYEIRRTFQIYYNDNGRFPLNRDEAINVIRTKLAPHNLPYPWKHTTILDENVYTKSCYKALPEGSEVPDDYIWLWPLPKRKVTEEAVKNFFPIAVQIPYDVNCPNAPEGTKYFVAITSSTVLIVGKE